MTLRGVWGLSACTMGFIYNSLHYTIFILQRPYIGMALKGERKIPQERVVEILKENPIVSANEIASLLKVNFRTARNRMEELVEDGLLSKTKHKTNKNLVIRYKLELEDELELSLSENESTPPEN